MPYRDEVGAEVLPAQRRCWLRVRGMAMYTAVVQLERELIARVCTAGVVQSCEHGRQGGNAAVVATLEGGRG